MQPQARPLPVAALLALLAPASALALPTGPRALCSTYPAAPACLGKLPSCAQCHSSAPAFNPYGEAVAGALYASGGYAPNYADPDAWQAAFEAAIPAALTSLEGDDSDGDGLTNLEELNLGTIPGDPLSFLSPPPEPLGDPNPVYDVSGYDARFAYRRVSLTYCGQSPSYDDMSAFDALSAAEQQPAVHDLLDTCLQSSFWKEEALPRLADARIRPLLAIGADEGSVIPLGDYNADYRLFVHVLTDDRDARDLLLADYYVDAGGNVVQNISGPGVEEQLLAQDKRAGMITTRWFLLINTMFSPMPRTTAAAAYRSYLGQNIAKSEGLSPVQGEPIDVDNKGVTQEVCARCHTTLDPLSYAFAYYNGIGGNGGTGAFDPGRPSWNVNETSAVLLGEPINDAQLNGVVGWAQIAVGSDHFKRNLVDMFLEHAVGRPVRPSDYVEIAPIMDAMPTDGYSANRLIHRIVDTAAFGRP